MESENFSPAKSSNYLSQILLIAIPLISAPFAFLVGGEYGNTGSLGLEYLLIGFLTVEFIILFLFNQKYFKVVSPFDDEEPVLEIVILNLSCLTCNKQFETEQREKGIEISCPHCGTTDEM